MADHESSTPPSRPRIALVALCCTAAVAAIMWFTLASADEPEQIAPGPQTTLVVTTLAP